MRIRSRGQASGPGRVPLGNHETLKCVEQCWARRKVRGKRLRFLDVVGALFLLSPLARVCGFPLLTFLPW